MSRELFTFGTLIVTEEAGNGARVRIAVDGRDQELPEGLARKLHLALRDFVRRQKRARGDTPRGRRQLALNAQPQLVQEVSRA